MKLSYCNRAFRREPSLRKQSMFLIQLQYPRTAYCVMGKQPTLHAELSYLYSFMPPLAQQVNVHPLLQMYSAHHKVCNFPLHRATSSLLLPSACSTSSSSEPRGESATPCSLRRRTAVLNKLFSSGVPSHQQGLRLSYEMKIEKKSS